MRILQETPEVEWTQVFGVIWNEDPEAPFVEYESLEEAQAVAEAAHGRLVVKYFWVTGWVPL